MVVAATLFSSHRIFMINWRCIGDKSLRWAQHVRFVRVTGRA